MTLGEFWEEYHTAITLISGGALSLLLYKLPKPNTALKVLIFVVALFFLTGLLGLIKFAVIGSSHYWLRLRGSVCALDIRCYRIGATEACIWMGTGRVADFPDYRYLVSHINTSVHASYPT